MALKAMNMRSCKPHLVYLLDIFIFICGFVILNEKFEFPIEWTRKNKAEPGSQHFFPYTNVNILTGKRNRHFSFSKRQFAKCDEF